MLSQPAEGNEPSNRSRMERPVISMRGIQKKFGALLALRGVDFDVLPGEVHGLLGQNGAGKTTLIKIMAGIEMPTAGDFRIDGKLVRLTGVADSKARGISVVHQSLSLVPSLTVADNMFLGDEVRRAGLFLGRRSMNKAADEVLTHYGIPLRPNQLVSSLPFAYRQLLEIAKALALKCKVLILDEPTSSLTKADEPILFSAVREMTAKGIGVIYVSHRLSEIMELTNRVTVFRDGANVGSFQTADTTIPDLVEAIVGRPIDLDASLGADLTIRPDSPVLLELKDVHAKGVNGANLAVRSGEIVGLVGTTGSGRTEVLETVFGMRPLTGGVVEHRGERFVPRRASESIKRSIKLVPEDRHKWGLVLDHDIEHNLAMATLPEWTKWGVFFKAKPFRARAEELRTLLQVKAPSVEVRVDRLSGGNQQKVVIGKWLNGTTDVLLLDEPTAGVDVGARSDIYRIILELVRNGTAVMVSSSDYSELMQICTSFLFVVDGRIAGSTRRSQVSDEKQLHQMLEDARKGETP